MYAIDGFVVSCAVDYSAGLPIEFLADSVASFFWSYFFYVEPWEFEDFVWATAELNCGIFLDLAVEDDCVCIFECVFG